MNLSQVRIVLVEPSHPGNIGGAARALKTMGLKDLAVVNPGRFPDPQAEWRAAGAQDVLESTRSYESLDAAIADRHWVVGTSTRTRRIPWPLHKAGDVASQILQRLPEQRVAIVFGRENSGLSNEELQKCHCHLVIPANPEYSSLNLAMAVQVVCYELFRQLDDRSAAESTTRDTSSGQTSSRQTSSSQTSGWDRAPATSAATEGLLAHFEQVLIESDFLDPENPGQTMTRLRRLILRITPDETEVQMLRGILKHIQKPR